MQRAIPTRLRLRGRVGPRSRPGARRSSLILASALAISTTSLLATVADAATSGPRHGGNVTMVSTGVPVTLDPALNFVQSFQDSQPMAAIYGLLVYENAKTGALQMGFAQSVTPSKNDTVWTIVLHKGIKFSDGTPYNAAAVAATIARDANPATASSLQSYAATLKVKVVNATTLKITLPVKNTQFGLIVSQDFPFIPSPTAVASEGSQFPTHPVGAGPFQVATYVPGSSVSLYKNPQYTHFAPGQPYLNNLQFTAIPVESQDIAALQTGTAQLSWSSSGLVTGQMLKAGITVLTHYSVGGAYLMENTQTAPFNDPVARRAVQLALDRKAVANAWAPDTPVTTNLFPASSPFYNAKYNWPAKDAATAQQLFNQLASEGKALNFTLDIPVGYAPLGASVQSQLEAYQNVTVNVATLNSSQYNPYKFSGNFQMTEGGIYVSNMAPIGIEDLQAPALGGSLNYGGWVDPIADAALTNLTQTTNQAQEAKDWAIVEKQLIADGSPDLFTQVGDIGLDFNRHEVGGIYAIEFGQTPLWGQVYRVD